MEIQRRVEGGYFFSRSGAEFTWMCPLFPRMESGVSQPERLHFVRLNAEEMLNE